MKPELICFLSILVQSTHISSIFVFGPQFDAGSLGVSVLYGSTTVIKQVFEQQSNVMGLPWQNWYLLIMTLPSNKSITS